MKRVFVGSTREALEHAKQVAGTLRANDIETVMWPDAFKPGVLTFEAIETVTKQVDGAVFVVSPDDRATVRGSRVILPRSNVLLEWGYFAAVLTRARVALCIYETDSKRRRLTLPTDLDSLTYIPMGTYIGDGAIPVDAITKIIRWADTLTQVTHGESQTTVCHGYSGKWRVSGTFTIWHDKPVSAPDNLTFNGEMVLFLPLNGGTATGCVTGEFREERSDPHTVVVRKLTDSIESAFVDPDGTLTIWSHLFQTQVTAPTNILDDPTSYYHYSLHRQEWVLHPINTEKSKLEGKFTGIDGSRIFTEVWNTLTRE